MERNFSKKPEILAPCGGEESIYAAVHCGADAVYLGQSAFNARQNAANFSGICLSDAVSYCHLYGVKVYQTLNTLVFDSELDALKTCIRQGCEAGVDAFIVQDMGVLSLVRQLAPDMPIHASTQMTVHTPSGARYLESLGVQRVVLARELSLREIAEIRAASSIELEVFVHGALCVCVSGQCYMSGMLGGRSGNRGNCAQPCRLPFAVNGDGAADLSLKDLSAIDRLDQLAAEGISSFKIEGRMKRPEYVAAAVTACVQKLRGERPDMERLRAVFSRSGFTDGYLSGKRGREMFGSRQKEDVVAASEVLKPLRQLYHKPTPRVACVGELTAIAGEPIRYRMWDQDGNQAVSEGDLPEAAERISTTLDAAESYLGKLGGTPFFLERLEGRVEEGLMLPARVLNSLRRDCTEQLTSLRSRSGAVPFSDRNISLQTVPKQRQKLRLRLSDVAQLRFLSPDAGEILLPVEQVLKEWDALSGFEVIPELPRVFFGLEESLKKQLAALKERGCTRVLVQNIGQIPLCRELGLSMSGGFGLNVTNSYAAEFYRKEGISDLTISFELSLEEAGRMTHVLPIGAVAYGHLPLMITRSCPLEKYRSCQSCDQSGSLTDRQGKVFSVRCHGGVREIYNPDLLYLADRLAEFKRFDGLTLYFTDESPEMVERTVLEYQTGQGRREKLTRGLYYRKV